MNTPVIITLSVFVGAIFLLTVIRSVAESVQKKLEAVINERFKLEEIIASTTRANFFGVESRGGKQLRGKGALVLTGKTLYFFRAVPFKEYRIPLHTMTKISTPRSFNKKSVIAKLLCVHYNMDSQQDAMAWAVREPGQWKSRIESLIKRKTNE